MYIAYAFEVISDVFIIFNEEYVSTMYFTEICRANTRIVCCINKYVKVVVDNRELHAKSYKNGNDVQVISVAFRTRQTLCRFWTLNQVNKVKLITVIKWTAIHIQFPFNYIYMYAFGRCFIQITCIQGLYLIGLCISWEWNPWPWHC